MVIFLNVMLPLINNCEIVSCYTVKVICEHPTFTRFLSRRYVVQNRAGMPFSVVLSPMPF